MSVMQVGNSNTMGTNDKVLFRTYSYQNGKGQEKVYYAKDCVELSLESYTVATTADNYEEIKNMLKSQSSGKIISPGNKFFSETYEIMKDYYNGDLCCDEVKNIFKEYVYHSFGKPSETSDVSTTMSVYGKQRLTGWLSGLYEYFSRANTRNACAQNMQEGKALMEENGIHWNGTYYYNSDWYYACEEMQNLLESSFMMFLLAAAKNTNSKNSLLLDKENYWDSSEWEENDTYQSAISFLKNFNINWSFKGNRFEFLAVG